MLWPVSAPPPLCKARPPLCKTPPPLCKPLPLQLGDIKGGGINGSLLKGGPSSSALPTPGLSGRLSDECCSSACCGEDERQPRPVPQDPPTPAVPWRVLSHTLLSSTHGQNVLEGLVNETRTVLGSTVARNWFWIQLCNCQAAVLPSWPVPDLGVTVLRPCGQLGEGCGAAAPHGAVPTKSKLEHCRQAGSSYYMEARGVSP